MGMSLLPPSTSSFRLEPDAEALMEITQGNPDINAEIGQILSQTTSRINNEIEAQQIRDSVFDMLQQLICVGSCIVEKVEKKGIIVHPLRSFVSDLGADGEPRGLCIVEKKKDLPEGIVVNDEKEVYDLYTKIVRDNDSGKWIVTQAIEGELVGEEQTYTDETLPFQYVGWTHVSGENFHRPYAEDYYPDMKQYDTLANLITKGSIVAAKSLLFVDQRGNRTKIKDITTAENGAVINGNAADVTAFTFGKNYDFQIPMERLQDIGKNLAAAFLMNESVTRDAERVTAQEIRFMAQELETSSLSGIYSKLSKSVSNRIVSWVMQELKIKFDGINVNVITGLDALGRSAEAQKLDSLVMRMANLGLNGWLNEAELIKRYASFDGIDTTNLIKTPNQVQQEQQQAAQAQMAQTGANAYAQSAGQAQGEQVPQQ
jgi:hypothetical protein